MGYCTSCGKQNAETAKYCYSCGTPIYTSTIQPSVSKSTVQTTLKSSTEGFWNKLIQREEKNAPITIIIGIALIIISQTANFTKTRTYDTYDMGKSMGMRDAYNPHILGKETYVDTKMKDFFLYGGLMLLAVGGYFVSRKQLV